MIYKVGENIFVGNQDDFYDQLHCELFTDNDAVILAGKVFHKQFARVQGCDEDGYVGNMDKNEPEYLAAYRDKPCDMLVLNLLDIDNAEFVSEDCIMKARNFANSMINKGYNAVIFDTKAESIAPAIAMLVLKRRGEFFDWDYERSKVAFLNSYPAFNPKQGIETVLKEMW
jgi:uncharacterized protein with NRDE domain